MKRRLSETMVLRGLRKKKMDEVRQLYAKFGDDVVQLMLHYALTPNGLRWVLQKLPIASKATREQQIHTRIVQFIQEKGVDSFLDAVKSATAHKENGVSKAPRQVAKLHSSPEPPKAPEKEPASEPQAAHSEQRSEEYGEGGKERRRHPRLQTNVRALVSITPSEERSTSLECKGAIRDISLFGLRVAVPKLRRSLYTMLHRSGGSVLVTAQLPGNVTVSRISGAIVWIDYYDDVPKPFCRMGVHIDRSSKKTNKEMEAAVNFFQSKTGGQDSEKSS